MCIKNIRMQMHGANQSTNCFVLWTNNIIARTFFLITNFEIMAWPGLLLPQYAPYTSIIMTYYLFFYQKK
jgi:hypothetical protein